MKGSGFLPILVAALAPLAILTLIISATGFGLVAWKPPILWSETFGGAGGTNSATVVASDSSGAYVAGYINNSRIGSGVGSLFLTKYDPLGGVVWTHTIGSTNDSYIDGMSVGPDGLYLSGGYIGGRTILKYDLAGNQVWVRRFALTGGHLGAISVSSAGVYLAGASGTPLTNQSYAGAVSFVRRYDSAGDLGWTNEFYNDVALIRGLYASLSGVYVGGIAQTPLPGQSQGGGFLVKYDSNGNLVWIRQFADLAHGGLAGDSTGVYVSGMSLQKYDFSGSLDWAVQIESPDSSGFGDSSLTIDSSGIYLSLDTPASHEFLMKYDLSGNLIWSLQMQPPADDYSLGPAFRLAAGASGVYVAGSVSGSLLSQALVALVASSPTLVFFSLNPPLSFVILGGLIASSVAGLFFFLRLRRGRVRPARVGPTPRSLPASD